MTSDPWNNHREYSPYGSCSLFQFEGFDIISVLKNSIEYSFVFFKCLLMGILQKEILNQQNGTKFSCVQQVRMKLTNQ